MLNAYAYCVLYCDKYGMCRGGHVAIVLERVRFSMVEMKGLWIIMMFVFCSDVIVVVQLGVI